jgi:hypothetical protein
MLGACAMACKPRFSARNHNDIPHDLRAIDRGIPNRQIASHQDFGGVRAEVFYAYLGSAPSSHNEIGRRIGAD